MITEIHIDSERPICRVVRSGTTRESFASTPLAVAMALLSQVVPEDREQTTRGTLWPCDMLATHGVAFGFHNRLQIQLAVVPPKLRTVSWSRGGESRQITATYPALLLGLATRDNRYVRGTIHVVNMAHQAQFAVGLATPCVVPFCYGNVYSGTGYICWGGVNFSDINNLQLLEQTFFASGFNTDLFQCPVGRYNQLGSLVASVPTTPHVLPPPTCNLPITSAIQSLTREQS